MKTNPDSMAAGRLRIVMVTGSCPPMRCGVGDYTAHLVERLSEAADVKLVTSRDGEIEAPCPVIAVKGWSAWRMPALALRLSRLQPDIVHLQYPTIGYGFKLGPQMLVMILRLMGIRTVVTLHEFKHARFLRKLASIPHILFASSLVFAADSELQSVLAWIPVLKTSIRAKSSIVPVGPGIFPATAPEVKEPGRPLTVAFFGLFYPGRLIEQSIEAFRLASLSAPGIRLLMAGDRHPRYQEYFDSLRAEAESSLPDGRVTWLLGRESQELAEAFSGVDVFVLPYPDGASFRRTSLLTAMSFGKAVITTVGPDTPGDLRDRENVLFAEGAKDMARAIVELSESPELYARISDGAVLTSQKFSWDNIAADHLRVYEGLSEA